MYTEQRLFIVSLIIIRDQSIIESVVQNIIDHSDYAWVEWTAMCHIELSYNKGRPLTLWALN